MEDKKLNEVDNISVKKDNQLKIDDLKNERKEESINKESKDDKLTSKESNKPINKEFKKDKPIDKESKMDKSTNKESKNDKSTNKESKMDKQINNESKNELNEEELLEFYKTKCEKLKLEINKYKDQCSQKETENYELTTKISELREIVDDSVSIKTNLENMGINVDELLDEIDDD